MEYGLIPFNPYSKGNITDESIDLLKNIILDGYQVYTLKNSVNKIENKFFIDLIDNHGFSFIEYSDSFCKMQFENGKTTMNITDEVCIKR